MLYDEVNEISLTFTLVGWVELMAVFALTSKTTHFIYALTGILRTTGSSKAIINVLK